MSDIIQLLPDSVANQIAAGEVIQRPASVVKELVENAVDAGATTINVLITDAGRTMIQVVDDGQGMSVTDARLAFERHATSKIKQAADLFNLHTNGFRGEALPSIAAVAQVELLTKREDDEIGTQLTIAGSKFVSQEPATCPTGSNFKVENLFYNVPARRKFLKSNSTELNNIVTAFERIALVNPSIQFNLFSNGSEMFNLKAGSLKQRIVDVFGKRISQDLLPLDVDTTLCKITGFVGKPESARKKGVRQYFFVNGRFMKHPYFNKAIVTAMDRLVPQGEQVPYFIYFTVNPNDIDVNIHPTKTEIKFENEQPIWQILCAAVREAVGKFNDVPSIDFDTEGRPDIPTYNGQTDSAQPRINYNPQYNPFKSSGSTLKHTAAPAQWEQLYSGLKNYVPSDQEPEAPADLFDDGQDQQEESLIAEKSPTHYQYKNRYIMTAVKSGLMIIDQHRAHIRILYEEYLAKTAGHRPQTQKLMFPETVQFSPSEQVLLDKILPIMASLGFDLSSLGGGSYAINGIPAEIKTGNVVKLVADMAEAAIERGSAVNDDLRKAVALSLARDAAIPEGRQLGNDEMESIVNRLFACQNSNYTPDGKNILCILRQQEIEHLLG